MNRPVTDEKGYALFMVISMSMVVAFLILAALSVYRVRQGSAIRYAAQTRARYLAHAGIAHLRYHLSRDSTHTGIPEWTTINLGPRGNFRVRALLKGGYWACESQGVSGKTTIRLRALLGETMAGPLQNAVLLADSGKDLELGSNTVITGDIALTGGLLHFERTQSGTGNLPVHQGRLFPQESPDLRSSSFLDRQIKTYADKFSTLEGCQEVIRASWFIDGKTAVRHERYLNRTLYIEGDLDISDSIHLNGPAVFVVEKNVFLHNTVSLHDIDIFCGGRLLLTDSASTSGVLFYSRGTATLSGNCRFSGQLISQDSIIFADQAATLYPTFVFSQAAWRGPKITGGIFTRGSHSLTGTFMTAANSAPATDEKIVPPSALLMIFSPQTEIHGVLYNNFALVSPPYVQGHVRTFAFLRQDYGTLRQNMLANLTIDHKSLSPRFIVPALFNAKPELQPIEWEELRD